MKGTNSVVFILILLFAIIPFVLILPVKGPDIQETLEFKGGRMIATDTTPMHPMAPYAFISVVIGWSILFYGIFQLHKAIEKSGASDYPISPAKSLALQIIPFFNFYGVFKWTNALLGFLNEKYNREYTKGILGFFLLIALLLAFMGSLPPGAVFSHSFALVISGLVYFVLSNRVNKEM